MNIQDYKIGDIAVLRDGTEARITNYRYRDGNEWLLWFDREVRGLLIGGGKSNNWLYRENGKFDTERLDGNDIVKIIRS